MPTVKGNTTPQKSSKVLESQKSARIPDYLWDEAKKELKTVKGRFRLYETCREGGSEKVTFRKYPPEICPMFEKTMKDGEIYKIPLYAARFINGYDSSAKKLNGNIHSCSYGIHGFKMANPMDLKPSQEGITEGGGGIPVPVPEMTQYKRRMGFESLEFGGNIE